MQSLHPRVRLQWILTAFVTASVLASVVVVIAVAVDVVSIPSYVPPAVGTTLGLAGVLHALARFDRWRYEIQEDALYLERGVITEVETAVPFVRVQHVDTQRDPIARLLGIASVVVYTAGSRGADVTVPGLTPDRAETLRNRLRELAVESEPDDGV
ncbi:MAG: PH domain-containing protein [Halobacteriales archaeon]